MLRSIIRFFWENQLVPALLLLLIIAGGLMVAPFNWDLLGLPRDPVPVDAIPDIGENQQIVFIEWISKEETMLNPYFGDEMLNCGSVTRTLSSPSK